jgi:predicted metal-dependent peptidase
MKPDAITERHISAMLMDIAKRNTFFASLSLQAKIEVSHEIPTAATDGDRIFVNPDFFAKMTLEEQSGVLLHEVLHAALQHVPRRGGRDPKLWNIAADIVVNGIITDEGYALPDGGLHDATLKRYGVEEVYEKILEDAERVDMAGAEGDLLDGPPSDATGSESGIPGKRKPPAKRSSVWANALEKAKQLTESSGQGQIPAGVARETEQLHTPQVDWRSYLWRFVVQSPSDFGGFDNRFIADGLYLEALENLQVNCVVAVDSSGSINQRELTALASEVRAITDSYPDINVTMYYADAEVYGPYELKSNSPLPEPRGGGGTDFRPFFDTVDNNLKPREYTVAVYLTDGYGDFPKQEPIVPTLWVVTPGGLALEKFPFGEAIRLLQSN